MKIIYKVILLSMFIIALIGCDNKVKFDRVEAFSEYATFPEYSPFSRNIKKQTIKEYENNLLISTTTIYADKKGRLTKLNVQSPIKLTSTDLFIDYNQLTFSLEQSAFQISIKDGDIALDEKGRTIKYSSKDGQYLFVSRYEGNKAISSTMTTPIFIQQMDLLWKNNLLIRQTASLSNNLYKKIMFEGTTTYNYDVDRKMILSETKYSMFNIDGSIVLSFDESNEFGDWTKAKRTTKLSGADETITTLTREIEYW